MVGTLHINTTLKKEHKSEIKKTTYHDFELATLISMQNLTAQQQAWTGHCAIAQENNDRLLFYGTMVQWPIQASSTV